jgi:hypothetical protein
VSFLDAVWIEISAEDLEAFRNVPTQFVEVHRTTSVALLRPMFPRSTLPDELA